MAHEIIDDVGRMVMEVSEQTIVDEGVEILPSVQLMLAGTSPEFSALVARFSGRSSELAPFATCPIDQALEAVADARNCFAIIDWPVHDRAAARLDLIVRRSSSRGGVLAVTRSTDVSAIVGALDRGVDDCVGYEIDIRELAARLRTIWRKLLLVRTATSSRGSSDLRPARPVWPASGLVRHLSPREQQVLEALAAGVDPKQIGDAVGCNYSTIRTHIRRLCSKLGCSGSREAIVRFYAELGT